VTWDWLGDHAKPQFKIAAVLNPRLSPDRVRDYVELMYVNSCYSVSEKIDYAKARQLNPYPAEFASVNGVRWKGQITCGHNPWLFARLVDGLVATGEPDDEDSVVWTERSRPKFDKGHSPASRSRRV
jgi:hypothetical protein